MKKFIKLAFVAVIAAVAGYNVYQTQSVMNGMSDFALANVEAFAQTEIDMRRGYNLLRKVKPVVYVNGLVRIMIIVMFILNFLIVINY